MSVGSVTGGGTLLYIIRHAEAEGNIYRRAHGHYNGVLMPNGLAQLECLGARFQGVALDAVCASDLYRARRTALAIAEAAGVSVRLDARLREMRLGPWEDKPWGFVAREYREEYKAFTYHLKDFHLAGAETLLQTADRAEEAVREMAARHRGGSVAFVSHGMTIRALLGRLLNIPDEEIESLPLSDNTSVTAIRLHSDGTAQAEAVGDASHLGELSTLAKQHWWRETPETRDIGFWYRPADMEKDAQELLRRQREAWIRIYATQDGFDDQSCLETTAEMVAENPRCAQFVMDHDKAVGLLLLSFLKSTHAIGHISLIELDEEYCGQGLGIQPIGEAVSVYRAEGKSALKLNVFQGNIRARKFYEKAGFLKTDEKQGVVGRLDVMHRFILPDREL